MLASFHVGSEVVPPMRENVVRLSMAQVSAL
jgi:hypothetical protein